MIRCLALPAFMQRAALCLWLPAVFALTALAPLQPQWRRLDSPNFIVIGEVGAGELRDIAVRFEGFRETTSPSFTGIEFIVYRDDLKGSVQCGPFTPPAPVYAAWKPGSAPTDKVAVAFEFLPLKVR